MTACWWEMLTDLEMLGCLVGLVYVQLLQLSPSKLQSVICNMSGIPK